MICQLILLTPLVIILSQIVTRSITNLNMTGNIWIFQIFSQYFDIFPFGSANSKIGINKQKKLKKLISL